MARQGRWLLLAGSLAAALAAGPGCSTLSHDVGHPSSDQLAYSACLPPACRNHVHVFFVHGLDPLDWANLSGVRDYLHSLGYVKTHYGQLYHTPSFEKELLHVHEEDPDARFVLIGFSFGANMVRNLALAAKEADIPIDLLVYLGGNTLKNGPEDHPDNVLKLVNILATGWIWNGDTFDNAENVNYSDRWHFGSPSHPYTLEMLGRELAVVAARVPFVDPGLPKPEEGRPAVQLPDGWDFLEPAPVFGPRRVGDSSPSSSSSSQQAGH
jgi:pimeloyl-ACP methyl ester carboxylesterase